jgi:hypothetical protein
MGKISQKALVSAIVKLERMKPKEATRLCDELYEVQPFLLGMVLVQSRLGISAEKHQVLYELLLTAFLAMREAGQAWPLVTEDRIELAVQRQVRRNLRYESLDAGGKQADTEEWTNSHPERPLLAWFLNELSSNESRTPRVENDKYWMLAGLAIVDCLAFPDATDSAPEPLAS